ncbi:Uncharacterised protein [Lysinibacillus sphaericus]|nr:Uncharacterised protein [Lysinibacillus sphaericus]
MNAFMLEGWTPILLSGILFMVIVFFISRKVSKRAIYSLALVLSLICIGVVISSMTVVGGWEGMGIAIVAISILIGIWIGTIIGIANRKVSI